MVSKRQLQRIKDKLQPEDEDGEINVYLINEDGTISGNNKTYTENEFKEKTKNERVITVKGV